MDSAARIRMMRHVREDLSQRGVVVCAVRYMVPFAQEQSGAMEEWVAATRQKLASTYGGHPELLAPLLEWLPGYARERRHREAIDGRTWTPWSRNSSSPDWPSSRARPTPDRP